MLNLINKSNIISIWYNLTIILIIGFGIFLRYDYFIHYSYLSNDISLLNHRWPDEATYFRLTSFILSHGVMEYLTNHVSYEGATPGNPIYLYFLYKWTGGDIFLMRLFQIFISGVTLLFVYKIGNKVFNKFVGVLALLICAWYKPLIMFSPTLLTEPIFSFYLVLIVYGIVNISLLTKKWQKGLYALFTALFLGLASWTRPIISILPIFLLIVGVVIGTYKFFILQKKDFSFLKNMLPVSLMSIAFILPLPLKNYVYFGEFMMAPGSFVNCSFYLGTRPDTEGDEPPARGLAYDCNADGQVLKERALNNIANYPVQYLYWNIKKIGRLLVGSNLFWCCPAKSLVEYANLTKLGIYNPAIVKFAIDMLLSISVAILGLWGAIKFLHNPQSLLLVLVSAFLTFFSILGLVNYRYGVPIFLINSILASAGFLEIVKNFKQHYDLAWFATFLIIACTLNVILDDLHFVLILTIVLFLIKSITHTRSLTS